VLYSTKQYNGYNLTSMNGGVEQGMGCLTRKWSVVSSTYPSKAPVVSLS